MNLYGMFSSSDEVTVGQATHGTLNRPVPEMRPLARIGMYHA